MCNIAAGAALLRVSSVSLIFIALAAAPVAAQSASQQVDQGSHATPIIHVGDPYPGRPGETVGQFFDDSPFTAGMRDAAGNVPFVAMRSSGTDCDLLSYHTSNGSITPMLQGGALTAEGLAIDSLFPTPVSANLSGQTIVDGVIRDIPTGLNTGAVLSIAPGGAQARIVASVIMPVPNQSQASWVDVMISTPPLGGINYNINSAGIVAQKSTFKIGPTEHLGVYNWTAAGGLKRVIDDTQAVPGHTNARWVTYVRGASDSTPFDPFQLQLTDTGETIFQGKFKIGTALSRGLFRASSAGAITAIVDPARGDQVPGRPAGYGFFSIPGRPLANRNGDVAFEAIDNVIFDRGVYLQRGAGQPVTKVHDSSDPIPSVPIGTRQTFINLLAMNDHADTVINAFFGAGGDARQALLLCTAAGETKLIARSDRMTGLPADAKLVSFDGRTAINDAGDVLSDVTFQDEVTPFITLRMHT